LLYPKSNFNTEILDNVLKGTSPPLEVLMVKITKKKIDTCSVKEFEIRTTTVGETSFKFFEPIKYSGYFNYKNHIVLVYGDVGVFNFFIKSTHHKYFSFLNYTHDDNRPPVAVEPYVYLYNVIDDKYVLQAAGMPLGF
jgi:hypothetical protein